MTRWLGSVLVAASALAFSLVACGGGPISSPSGSAAAHIAVPTQPPAPSGSPQACMAALLTGVLTADARWGLAVKVDADGQVVKVVWPHGYAARVDGTRLALIDTDHGDALIAHEGDRVEVGGGQTGDADTWLACPTAPT